MGKDELMSLIVLFWFCYFCTGATRELWVTPSPPSYTITTRRSRSHLRAPTRSLLSSMS